MIESRRARVSDEDANQRFDVIAARAFADLSRKQIKKIIDAGGAYLNKQRVVIAKALVSAGDLVELYWEAQSQSVESASLFKGVSTKVNVLAPRMSLDCVLYDCKDYVVVSKPAGIPTQATLVSSSDTLAHALNALDAQRFPLHELLLVHRLDKETSGVLILAKNKRAQMFFEGLFKEKKIKKEYIALCYGRPQSGSGIVSFPIAKDNQRKNAYFALTQPGSSKKEIFLKKLGAKSAVTNYQVERYFEKSQVSLVRLRPETGRTHQIRVHMQACHIPILGDKTYAQNVYGHPFGQPVLRHMLHACKLEFNDPVGVPRSFEASIPLDFERVLSLLEERER